MAMQSFRVQECAVRVRDVTARLCDQALAFVPRAAKNTAM